jgi:hypothetical protein
MDRAVENAEEALFRLKEIGRCRTYRNLLNHFAGKRYPNEDVYVLASKNTKDAEKVLGKKLDGHRVHFAVAGRAELFELEKLLNGYQAWLATKIPEWDNRYLKKDTEAIDDPVDSAT